MWSPSRVADQRTAKRKPEAFIFLNLWPFAAVMVVLVGIFLLSIKPHGDYRQIPTDIPKSVSATTQPGAKREDAIEFTSRGTERCISDMLGFSCEICQLRFKPRYARAPKRRSTSGPTSVQRMAMLRKSWMKFDALASRRLLS